VQLPTMRRLGSALVLVGASGALAGVGLQPVGHAEDFPSPAERIVAGFEATSAREIRLVESFTTQKTFTIVHGGRTHAQVVAALQFTAPDLKVFTVLESRGSDFIRTRVINRMMAAEIEAAREGLRPKVAINSHNYEFGAVREDGDAFVVEATPRRRDELLFRGRIWITKDGFHLKRIEGEPASNLSFWTKRVRFVTDFQPIDGVWVQVRTLAQVTIRWLGEYDLQSECGPYRILLASDTPGSRSELDAWPPTRGPTYADPLSVLRSWPSWLGTGFPGWSAARSKPARTPAS
jgi:hypothetical protein